MADTTITPPPTKHWWESKTIWLNVLVALASLSADVYNFVQTGGLNGLTSIMAGLAIANIVLRSMTSSALKFGSVPPAQ